MSQHPLMPPLRFRRAKPLRPSIFGLLLLASSLVSCSPQGLNPDGQWDPVGQWPLVAIHAVLTPEGDVLTYGTDANDNQTGQFIYDVWDSTGSVTQGHTTVNNTTQTDIFCSLAVLRPSGDVAIFGGDVYENGGATNDGNPDVTVFDTTGFGLTQSSPMLRDRWYATAITMPDGSVYVQGGRAEQGGVGAPKAERWTENGSVELPFDTSDLYWFYPRNFVIPDGRVFGYDRVGDMYTISADLQTRTDHGRWPQQTRNERSTAVMFEPGKILQFGGYSTAAIVIDMTGPTPVVTSTGSLSTPRHWANSTLLPDGRVLATGGSEVDNEAIGVNNHAEIWDPQTGEWTLASAGQNFRLYHSTAILLPDGRVLVAGGGSPGPIDQRNAEIFNPDYLVAANGSPTVRPVISHLSTTTATVGQSLSIAMSSTHRPIERVTLLKSGSVTHSFNNDQRFVELSFTEDPNSGALSVTLPSNPAVVTPGYYLVTAIDSDGIPSVSEMLQITI